MKDPTVPFGLPYTSWQTFWYLAGFLVWTPAYVATVRIAIRERRLEIPCVAATSNITWEFLWGFVWRQDMTGVLQQVYRGAFVLDLGVLFCVFRYGRAQSRSPLARRWHGPIVLALLLGWGAFYWSLRSSRFDLPLGSVSAYLDNIVMSALYVWLLLSVTDARQLSRTVAWSKGLGTGMVTVFIFLRYPEHAFVRTLAVLVSVLDVAYFVGLVRRQRAARQQGPHDGETRQPRSADASSNTSPATGRAATAAN